MKSIVNRTMSVVAVVGLLGLAMPVEAMASANTVTTQMVYVANEGSISAIDAATGKVVKNINLPNSSFVNGNTQPGYIAISPNQQTAYATTLNELVPINLMTNTTETPIPLGTTESTSHTAGHVVLSSDGRTAYVTDWDGNRVIVVNLQTGALSYITGLSNPLGMAIAPNGQTLYVANAGSNTVSVIDLASQAVTHNLQLSNGDTNPQDIAITADGSTAYVTDGDYSLSGYGSTITPINLMNLSVGNHIPAGAAPYGIAVTPGGATAYTANTNSNLVMPVNLTTQQAGTAITANLYHPTEIAISPDGTLAYVTDNGYGGGTGAQVTPINLATNTPESPINVGPYPLGVAFAAITQLAPNLSASLAPTTPNASNNRYSTPVTLTIATDNSSVPTEYSLDGGSTWHTYSGPVTFSANGAYTVTYGWADVSGTVHAEGSTSVDIAQAAPDISTNSVVPGQISTTGTTEVTVTPNTSGDTFAYALGSSPTLPPCVGDPLPNGAQGYTSGATISGVDVGQYLDIFEVSGNHQIQAWHEFSLTSADIQAPIGAPTINPSPTTVISGQTVTVTGVVYDVYHNPTSGAQIDLTSALGSWQTASVTTDASGVYTDQWTAPTVTTQTPITVTAAVYGTNMNSQATMTVSPTPVPTGLSHSSVTMTGWMETWSTVPGAALYNVFLNGAQVGSTTHAAYDFTGEQAGGSYSVSVTDAVYGVLSAASNPDSVTTSRPPLTNPAGSSQGSTSGNGVTSLLPTAVMQQSVDTKGGTWSTTHDGTSITIQAPVGAFPSPETVNVTTGSVADLGNKVTGLPSSNGTLLFGISFSGATPTQPITVTLENANIPDDAVVYKLQSDGSLKPLKATVSQGKVEISFSTDPDFVILAKQPNMRVITFANKVSIVPSVVLNDAGTPTTYMPIWYVMQMLKSIGVQSTWDGRVWNMSTSGHVSLGSAQPGLGTMRVYLNGTLVQNVTGLYATDASTGRKTTYMPIWYVMQVLNKLNLPNSWDGTTWSLGQQGNTTNG